MLHRLRPRSIYDVMAAIACFGVLAGGTAYAANTIRSTDIVDNEVYSADVRNDNLTGAGWPADIAPGAVTSSRYATTTRASAGCAPRTSGPARCEAPKSWTTRSPVQTSRTAR